MIYYRVRRRHLLSDEDFVNPRYQVYKSPDSHAAFVAAKSLIDKLVSGEVRRSFSQPRASADLSAQIEIDELTVESAKSSLAYNTAAKESTMNDAVRLPLSPFASEQILTFNSCRPTHLSFSRSFSTCHPDTVASPSQRLRFVVSHLLLSNS